MIDTIATGCKAAAVAAGGAVAVECADMFLGIPRDVLYAALAGACVGLARRRPDDWQSLLAPATVGWQYMAVILRSLLLAVTVCGNALVCAWVAQLLQHLPLTAEIAKLAPLALAGTLAWASWTLLPSAIESAQVWIKRKAEGQ